MPGTQQGITCSLTDLALSSDQGRLVAFQCPTRFPLSLLEVQGCAQPCRDLLSRKQDPVGTCEGVAHQGSPVHNGKLILGLPVGRSTQPQRAALGLSKAKAVSPAGGCTDLSKDSLGSAVTPLASQPEGVHQKAEIGRASCRERVSSPV